MTIYLTPDQERRLQLQAVMSRGACQSAEEIVEAALAAVEQRMVPAFTGTQGELDALLDTLEEMKRPIGHHLLALKLPRFCGETVGMP